MFSFFASHMKMSIFHHVRLLDILDAAVTLAYPPP